MSLLWLLITLRRIHSRTFPGTEERLRGLKLSGSFTWDLADCCSISLPPEFWGVPQHPWLQKKRKKCSEWCQPSFLTSLVGYRMVWAGMTFKIILFHPCPGHLQQEQVSASSLQPGLEPPGMGHQGPSIFGPPISWPPQFLGVKLQLISITFQQCR